MTHQWHETFHQAGTSAHHLDPRTKMAAGLIFVGTVLSSSRLNFTQAAGLGAVVVAGALGAQVPLQHIARRITSVLPFAILMMVSAVISNLSVSRLIQVSLKSFLSISAMSLLALTTPFPDMLRALEQTHTPKLLLLFLAFLYRYAAVLGKETLRLERGWSARYFGRFWLKQGFRLGHILAALLIRSYERAERIYAAMLSRGFSGATGFVNVLHFTSLDALFMGGFITVLLVIRLWGPAWNL